MEEILQIAFFLQCTCDLVYGISIDKDMEIEIFIHKVEFCKKILHLSVQGFPGKSFSISLFLITEQFLSF